MAQDLLENSDLTALHECSGFRGNKNNRDNRYSNFDAGTAYGEAKKKYAFDAKTSCQDLKRLLASVEDELTQQQQNSVSPAYKKKDQKVQAQAAEGFTKFKHDLEAAIDKAQCDVKDIASEENKTNQQTLDAITAASQAALSVTKQNTSTGGISNVFLYAIGGIALVSLIAIVAMKKKVSKTS